MTVHHLPVAVIGAGPIGLATAAHLINRGETPLILEAGTSVGSAVLEWGHVRLFSPWHYNIDTVAASMLADTAWTAPEPEVYPTGRELVERYLVPLARLPQIQSHLRLQTRVLSVSRQGFDKMKTPGREDTPFVIRVELSNGEEEDLLARAVIDASGTIGSPNSLGANGVPALGERMLQDRIFYGIPDVLGADWERYAGRQVLVVGSGHSALNALLDLAALAQQVPSTRLFWAVRRSQVEQLYGGGERDALPARGKLGLRLHELVNSGQVHLVTNVQIARLQMTTEGIQVAGQEEQLPPVDEIIATTGFRPDLSMLSEVRLGLDSSLESPVALAPLIDPNVHSCGTVPPHGVGELAHPEPNFYIVGMKSYGRAPTFLMLTGYEQVRSIVAALSGDWENARIVKLALPETGVCSTDQGGSCALPTQAGDAGHVGQPLASSGCCTIPARVLLEVGTLVPRKEACCG